MLQDDVWKPGKEILEDYVILKSLGRGGAGQVFLVKRRSTRQLFAVKTMLSSCLSNISKKQNFLRELRIWIELPDHPNIVSCRFFRTVSDRIAIFADYIEGGTLKERIRTKQLLKIEDILDVSIQIIRGLQIADARNIVHQDIKPANILMTSSGTVKITDFGLARALNIPRLATDLRTNMESYLCTSSGMTPAYCSPEQANKQKLDSKTDMWSWALTVLEMFTGRVTWNLGLTGAAVLESIVDSGAQAPFPEIPAQLVEILAGCFMSDPADRWDSFEDIESKLIKCYRENTDSDYPRPKPLLTPQKLKQQKINRSFAIGFSWKDPEEFFKIINKYRKKPIVSKKCTKGINQIDQALLDLERYNLAEKELTALTRSGNPELLIELALLIYSKAKIHKITGDIPGAVKLFDQAIKAFELSDIDELRRIQHIMSTSIDKANMFSEQYWDKQAQEIFDQLIEKYQSSQYSNDNDVMELLAKTYINKAISQTQIDKLQEGLVAYKQAIKLRQQLINTEYSELRRINLARTYGNCACILFQLEHWEESRKMFKHAIVEFESIYKSTHHSLYHLDLSRFYSNYARCLMNLKQYKQAYKVTKLAIKIIEKMAYEESSSKVKVELPNYYILQGECIKEGNLSNEYFLYYDRAISLLEKIYYMDGNDSCIKQLASALNRKAGWMIEIKEYAQAEFLLNDSLKLFQQIQKQGIRIKINAHLAILYNNKGAIRIALNEYSDAERMLKKAESHFQKALPSSFSWVHEIGEDTKNLKILLKKKRA